ncbi:DUF3025 domain-containing protein [Dyella sp.]|uniref:DUF3025 domain-containing protein n=1 Tax=Dyella sp. TaxID=1869338 RepID=UPI002ED40C24
MRYVAPAREAVDASVFASPPLSQWSQYLAWLCDAAWPDVDALNARWPVQARERFVAQTRALLDDGLHYEARIAQTGHIATRESNWHDLFNALIWLRYPQVKRALNAQQVAQIAIMGPKQRSRPQCALTHFDEAGAIVIVRDRSLMSLWDSHDWHGLFWRERRAWEDGRIEAAVFGHALLEHALTAGKLLVAKALVFQGDAGSTMVQAVQACALAIGEGRVLRDPLELRPLPLSGIPGWHRDNTQERFHHHAACYQPLRAGRTYPVATPLTVA